MGRLAIFSCAPLGSCYSRPVPAILTARARGAMSAAITAERCEAGEADQAVAIARLAVSQANRSICGAMDTHPDPAVQLAPIGVARINVRTDTAICGSTRSDHGSCDLTTVAPDKIKAVSRKMKLFCKRASPPRGMLKPTCRRLPHRGAFLGERHETFASRISASGGGRCRA